MNSKKPENVKEYNKKYYAKNADKIKAFLAKKEKCPNCGKEVTHQNMPNHQRTQYCQKNGKNKLPSINEVMNELKTLKAMLQNIKPTITTEPSTEQQNK